MKKLRVLLLCAVVALAAVGIAACGGEKEAYTVTFDAAGGGTFEPQTVKAGEKAQKPDDPSKTGWTFTGWELDGAAYTFTEPVTADITLVAGYASVLGGAGTAEDPFTVDSAEELTLLGGYLAAELSEFTNGVYKQTANITSTLTAPMARFAGTYNGGGFTMETTQPLFAELSGRVENLKIQGNVTSDAQTAGILACVGADAYVSRVTVSGSITAQNGIAGGILGTQSGGRIEYATVTASVTANTAGGMAGESNGVLINGTANGQVTANGIGGGIAGRLRTGGLVQNCGFGGSVTATGDAGGIAGGKEENSSVYRGFVYGNGAIAGTRAGGILGTPVTDILVYPDVLHCMTGIGVTVSGQRTVCEGGETTDANNEDFAQLGLPLQIWNTTGIPVLKETVGTLPATLKIKYVPNGEDEEDYAAQDTAYGSHVPAHTFTQEGMRFSELNELDAHADFVTVTASPEALRGLTFTHGLTRVTFTETGATLAANGAAEKTLTYAGARIVFDTFADGRDEHQQVIYRRYAAPYYVYTDGENEIIYRVIKSRAGAGYVGYVESYTHSGMQIVPEYRFMPQSDAFFGAYEYAAGGTTHYVIVDPARSSDANGETVQFVKYYMTNTANRPVLANGNTYLYWVGGIEADAYATVFSYQVNDTQSNFLYAHQDGTLRTGAENAEVTYSRQMLSGTWYNGTGDKFAFTITGDEEKTYAVRVNDGDAQPYAFAETENAVVFGAYTLIVAPTEYGACKLVAKNGEQLTSIAAFAADALLGDWTLTDGKVLRVGQNSVTVDGVAATDVADAVYNGMQAIRFTHNGTAYDFVAYVRENTAVLIAGAERTVAVNNALIQSTFAGEFSGLANGARADMTISIDADGHTAVAYGAESVTAKPVYDTENGLRLAYVQGAETIILSRKNDVLIAASGDSAQSVYASKAQFDRFVVTGYTNGTQSLTITANGAATEEGQTPDTALTAEYSEDRYINERQGFILSYTAGGVKYFYQADADVENVWRYKIQPTDHGDIVVLCTNFVPQNKIAHLFGNSFVGEFNGHTDTIAFAQNGALSRTYTPASEETTESMNWYPYLTDQGNGNVTLSARTRMADEEEGTHGVLMTFNLTGINWNDRGYVNEALEAILNPFVQADMPFIYKNGKNSVMIRLFTDKLEYYKIASKLTEMTKTPYYYDAISVNGDTLTVSLSTSGGTQATAVFSTVSGEKQIAFTPSSGSTVTFIGEPRIDHASFAGTYVDSAGVEYKVTATSSGITLQYTTSGMFGTTYNFVYTQGNFVVLTTEGKQALRMPRNTSSTQLRFVWKEGENLIICEKMDSTKKITAADTRYSDWAAAADLGTVLGGKTFAAADGSELVFAAESLHFTLGDNSYTFVSGTRSANVYTLNYGNKVVLVQMESKDAIEKLLVGETAETATQEFLPPWLTPAEFVKTLSYTGYYGKGDTSKTLEFDATEYMGSYTYYAYVGGIMRPYSSGTFENGTYTLTYKQSLGTSIVVTVTMTSPSKIASVSAKVGSGETVEYEPVVPLTANEAAAALVGKTYQSTEDATVTAEFTENWMSSQVTLNESYYYNNDGTVNGKEYTLKFAPSIGAAQTVVLTLTPFNEIATITIDGVEYELAA